MAALLPLEEAQQRLINLARRLPSENIPITEALGRYLAENITAKRSQPAADMSAMDGYAIRFTDHHSTDRAGPWTLIGECKAGSPPCRALEPGETARIFTGALLPGGADTVVMQENVTATGNIITLTAEPSPAKGRHVRHKGSDFSIGDTVLHVGTKLTATALGHAVIAGHDSLPVIRRAKIAILSTGDELVPPGAPTAPHQIPASNDVMVSAMLSDLPTETINISRIGDNIEAMCEALVRAKNCDIIVTIGGASVGDHDLVAPAFKRLGGKTDFYKIAMKPGKPLIAGTLGKALVLALPGNPGSAFVTATLFLLPLVRYLTGAADYMPVMRSARTTEPLPAVQDRAQFLRAKVTGSAITPFNSQDSAKLSVLAAANALLYRAANAAEQPEGAEVEYIAV